MNPAPPEKERAVGWEGFLHGLYVAGRLDRELLASFAVDPMGDEAAGAVAAFEALAGTHPARDLGAGCPIAGAGPAEVSRAGLFGWSLPREHGGLGLSVTQYHHVIRRVAPLDFPLILAGLTHLSLGVQPVVLYGTEAQRERYLGPAARGDMIFAHALAEPAAGCDAAPSATLARLSDDGSHYILDGRRTGIFNAEHAGAFTVYAHIDGAPGGTLGAFVVERGWTGVTVGPGLGTMGLTTASVRFEGVRVPVENRLGGEGEGEAIARAASNHGRLAVCAAAVGLMEQSVADMVKRAADRHSFGVPIASFELVREKIAAGRIGVYVAESMVAFAARQLERDPTARVAVETGHCKCFCTARAWQTLHDALQVVGDSGCPAANPYEKRLRDFRGATLFEETTGIHSIGPVLSLARSVAETLPRSTPARLLALHRRAWARLPRFPERGQRVLDGALARARRAFWGVRFRLCLALVLHGKGLVSRALVARRITRLSTHAFGLMAVVLRFDTDRVAGRAEPEGLDLVAAFAEEVGRLHRENRRVVDSREERLQMKIAERLTEPLASR